MSVTEETSKHVGSFIDALKKEPLSLALILMNLALLAFFYVFMSTIANQREREVGLLYSDKKEVRELLARCVVPQHDKLRIPERGALPFLTDPTLPVSSTPKR